MKTSKYLVVSTLAALFMMASATTSNAASAASYDLTTDPTGLGSATINGAIWEIFQSSDPTGSGVFYSFLRVQQTPTERGYNTDGRPLQFDENTSATFTHSFHLRDVPQIDIGGTIYREFQLDLNEKNSDPDWYISLDQFQVWATNDPNILGYDESKVWPALAWPDGTGTGEAKLVYDLDGDGNTWIMMDYRANNGSGKRDYRVYVPESDFAGKMLEYVVLFTRHGAQGGDWYSDSGFEEWGVAQYPATKAGYKFNDLNGNGVWDGGEPGLSGWTINLVGESIDDKGHTHAVSMSTVTDIDGSYSFSVLQGNYTVSEVMQPGWAQTFPGGDGTYVVSLGNGQLELNNNFGNVQYVPDISINKSADIEDFCLSDAPAPVTYTYLVENTGNEPLENVDVTDDTCTSPTYQSGDDGDDDILSPGEIWTYQCTTLLDDATTNTGSVVAYGVFTGTEVTDSDTAFVDVVDLDVTVDPATAEICAGDDPVLFCVDIVTPGSGDYSYSWTKDGSPLGGETSDCITVSEAGEYCVTVHDNETGCEDTACATLTVISPPSCSIDGPSSVCATETNIGFCSLYPADTYSWSIDEGGDADIVSATDANCVLVTPTGAGSFTLRLRVCNEGEVIECCDECTLNVTVKPCTPGIHVEKYPDIDSFCLSDVPVQVTYTYEVTATGDEPLENVSVEDDTCFDPTYVSGDDGDDNILGLDETWIYTCTMDLYDTTTNTVDVVGYGVNSGNEVTDETTATVTAHDLEVEVTPADSEICEGADPVHLCVDIVTAGSGSYSYLWSTGAETECIDVNTAGTYSVTVTDNVYGCEDTAEATLDVIDIPDCTIVGPPSLCVGDQVQFCASVSDAYSYVWVIAVGSEYAEIVGDDTGNCVTVHATGEGTFRLGLQICNAGDVILCCDECSIDVPVEPCGGAFCTLTQGFYGNKGGKACGLKTADLIDALLAYGDVEVGVPGHLITLGSSDCIIDLLPAGGTPDVLPAGDFVCDEGTNTIPASLLTEFSKKESRFNNVLIGQIVALTLNLRLYNIDCVGDGGTGNLAAWELPAEFCTMGKDGCAKKHTTPDAFVGLDVATILALANEVIGGEDVGVSPSEINGVVDFINEAFDGCKEIVTCPTVEICNNGCDDDFDGLVDCADPDCSGDPACIVE